MADHLAIGGVSLTLQALLQDRMVFTNPALPVADRVSVTVSAPDATHDDQGPRINLFLYNITENGYLKNQEIPGQGHPAAYGHPPLSLDLHYLVTGYPSGETDDIPAHRALGDAMRVFHEFSTITDGLMRQRNAGVTMLDTSLLGEFERIKITLSPLSLEDNSKIWMTLPETNFRCSVAYDVSVVQIESRSPRRVTLPVRLRSLTVFPFSNPQISEVFRDPPLGGVKNPIAAVGETLIIRGVNLGGLTKQVTLGGVDMPVVSRSEQELEVTVPAGVTAGPQPLQVFDTVVVAARPGEALDVRRTAHSNAVAVLVIPEITAMNPPAAGAGGNVTLTLSPVVEAQQQIEVLLGDRVLAAQLTPAGATSSADVLFQLPTSPAIPAGSPLIRVRVDGAESRLTFDASSGLYDGPTYTAT